MPRKTSSEDGALTVPLFRDIRAPLYGRMRTPLSQIGGRWSVVPISRKKEIRDSGPALGPKK